MFLQVGVNVFQPILQPFLVLLGIMEEKGQGNNRIKRVKVEGKKCHTKTMMSKNPDKILKQTPSVCHLDKTRRGKDEGRG